MREILFRGKRKDNGEWIEGIPIKTYDTEIGMNLPLRYKPKNITLMNNDRVLLCCAMDESAYFDTEDYPLIDDETIGQYTGLKDLHGTRIFEGDILIYIENGEYDVNEKYLVVWDRDDAGFRDEIYIKGKVTALENISPHDNFEVIGNIHDNPELLKGGAENE